MAELDPDRFNEQFQRFTSQVPLHNDGHPFTSFGEGVVAHWEDYKPYLRDRALGILVPDIWTAAEIGASNRFWRDPTAHDRGDRDTR